MSEQSVYAQKPWLKNYDYWAPATTTFPQQSLYSILSIAASLYRERPATAWA